MCSNNYLGLSSHPEVIESAGAKTGKAHLIKSHHNVGGLPEHMKLKLCEPLRELFKDEVRRVGASMGIRKGTRGQTTGHASHHNSPSLTCILQATGKTDAPL